MERKTILTVLSSISSLKGVRRYSPSREAASLTRAASTTSTPKSLSDGKPYTQLKRIVGNRKFSRLATGALLRSVVLGQLFRMPFVFRPSLYILEKIANSKSPFLDADRNPILRAVIYPLIYKQFCAGRDKTEIQRTIAEIKKMGYAGVILCYSKEIMAQMNAKGDQVVEEASDDEKTRRDIHDWRDGNLTTLSAVSEGDYIGLKLTGAGPTVSQALKDGRAPSNVMRQALHDICDQAQAEKKRLWIDAEQQLYHPAIDGWTVDLMRKYNRDGNLLVSTTIQCYLKSSRDTVAWYLRQAKVEGWTLGIKLVRGAYINSEVRGRIHDTKADTDASYNGIAHDMLSKSWPGVDRDGFPSVRIFLAGHNVDSIRRVASLAQSLAATDDLAEPVHYGQLQGMADDIGCEMLALCEETKAAALEGASPRQARNAVLAAPCVYKCLTWGPIKDCLHYLVRRAVENRSAAEKMGDGLKEMRAELRRRILRFGFDQSL